MIYALPLSPAEKLLLLLLSEWDVPTQEDLAAYVGVTPRRVRQIITGLIKGGYLTSDRRGRRKRYSLRR